MATYASSSDFIAAFPTEEVIALSNLDDPSASVADTDRITDALDRAESLMNSYIGIVETLPLSSVPVVVQALCLDIARYFLDVYRTREDVRQRYEDAIQWLERLAKAEVSLGLNADGDTLASDVALPTYEAEERVFTLGKNGTLASYY